jgi:hypothetical protein
MNFFITGLPRSRTCWFSKYFTHGDVYCWHEGMKGVKDKGKYFERMDSKGMAAIGNSDSGLMLGGYIEGYPLVIIERDIDDVEQAMAGIGYPDCRAILEYHARLMGKMRGLRVKFTDIDERLEEIHNYCIDIPYDRSRAERLMAINIQLDEIIPDAKAAQVWR